MTNRELVRRNLNRLLYVQGKNQADIVTYTGYSSGTVSDWLNGKKYPRAEAMQKLADFFGVSIFELVSDYESDEERIVHMFRKLSSAGKKKAIERMEELLQLYWYEKDCVAKGS